MIRRLFELRFPFTSDVAGFRTCGYDLVDTVLKAQGSSSIENEIDPPASDM